MLLSKCQAFFKAMAMFGIAFASYTAFWLLLSCVCPREARAAGGNPEQHKLANGLRVVIQEDHSFPVVASMVWYRVGSRNETLGSTGITHLVEHLLFGNVGSFRKGEIGAIVARHGGQFNAFTSDDFTTFFEVLPPSKLELALRVEAERMRGGMFSENDVQAEIARLQQEFEEAEKDPVDTLAREVRAAAFNQHPYHNPTTGWRSDVDNLTAHQARAYYNQYFKPDNATVVIVGDVQSQTALALVKRYFESVQKGESPPPPVHITEPTPKGERRVAVKYAGKQEVLHVAYHAPALEDIDAPAMFVLEKVLNATYSGRLKSKLVGAKLSSSAQAAFEAKRDPGLFTITCYAGAGIGQEDLLDGLDAAISQLRLQPVTDAELRRAKSQAEFTYASEGDGPYRAGFHLGFADSLVEWQRAVTWLERIRAVSATDVQKVAKRYLSPDARVIGWLSTPNAVKPAPARPAPGESTPPTREQTKPSHSRQAMGVRLTGFKEDDFAPGPNAGPILLAAKPSGQADNKPSGRAAGKTSSPTTSKSSSPGDKQPGPGKISSSTSKKSSSPVGKKPDSPAVTSSSTSSKSNRQADKKSAGKASSPADGKQTSPDSGKVAGSGKASSPADSKPSGPASSKTPVPGKATSAEPSKTAVPGKASSPADSKPSSPASARTSGQTPSQSVQQPSTKPSDQVSTKSVSGKPPNHTGSKSPVQDSSEPLLPVIPKIKYGESRAPDSRYKAIQERVLKNGVTLVVFETHLSPIVQIAGAIRAGDAYDPAAKRGVASVVAQGLNFGSPKHNRTQLTQLQEDIGLPPQAMLKFESGNESITFQTRCLSRDLSSQLGYVAECLTAGGVAEADVEKIKQDTIAGMKRGELSPSARVERAVFKGLISANSPYTPADPAELAKSIGNLSTADVKAFHQEFVVPSSTTIVLAGDVTLAQAAQIVENALGNWNGTSRNARPLVQPSGKRVMRTTIPTKDGAEGIVCLGQILRTGRHAQEFGHLLIADCVLASHPMLARVGQSCAAEPALQDKIGADNVQSSLQPIGDVSIWSLQVTSPPDVVHKAVQTLLAETKKIAKFGVTQEELSEAKRYLAGSTAVRGMSNLSVAAKSILESRLQIGEPDFMPQLLSGISDADVESVNRVIRNHLKPDQATMVIAAGAQSIKIVRDQVLSPRPKSGTIGGVKR